MMGELTNATDTSTNAMTVTANQSNTTDTGHDFTGNVSMEDLYRYLLIGVPCGVLVIAGCVAAVCYICSRHRRQNRNSMKEDLVAKYSTVSNEKGRLTTIIDFMDRNDTYDHTETSDTYNHTDRHRKATSTFNHYDHMDDESYSQSSIRNKVQSTSHNHQNGERCIDSAYDLCEVDNGQMEMIKEGHSGAGDDPAPQDTTETSETEALVSPSIGTDSKERETSVSLIATTDSV